MGYGNTGICPWTRYSRYVLCVDHVIWTGFNFEIGVEYQMIFGHSEKIALFLHKTCTAIRSFLHGKKQEKLRNTQSLTPISTLDDLLK